MGGSRAPLPRHSNNRRCSLVELQSIDESLDSAMLFKLRRMDDSGTGPQGRVSPSEPGALRAVRRRESWRAEAWLCAVPVAPRSAVRALWAAAVRPCHGPATTGVVRQLNSRRLMRILIVQCYCSIRHMDDSGTGPTGRVSPSGPGALDDVRRRELLMAESWR